MQNFLPFAEETDEKEDQGETDGQEYTKEDSEEDIEGNKENEDDSASKPHDLYEEWSNWSDCNLQHYKFRTRRCKSDQHDCSPLPEHTREVENCQRLSGDEGLGEWINQGACQVGARQCGTGEQMKVRQCYLDQPRLV